MGKLLKRLLNAKGSKKLTHQSESSQVDSPSESFQTESKKRIQTDQNPQEPADTICPNDRCGKTIPKPLKLTDLSGDETYYACPYCLSKLDITAAELKVPSNAPIKKPESPKQTSSEKPEGPGKCPQYLGYLRERPKDTEIPNECMACPDAVKCLLG